MSMKKWEDGDEDEGKGHFVLLVDAGIARKDAVLVRCFHLGRFELKIGKLGKYMSSSFKHMTH